MIKLNNAALFSLYLQNLSTMDSNDSNTLHVYSGTIPDDANIFHTQDNLGAYDAQRLATWSTFTVYSTEQVNMTFQAPPNPTTVNATGTGTATWWSMHFYTGRRVFIGETCVPGGDGTLALDSLSLVSGQPVTVLDFKVTMGW